MMKLIMILVLGLALQGCAGLSAGLKTMGDGLTQSNNRSTNCNTTYVAFGQYQTHCQ